MASTWKSIGLGLLVAVCVLGLIEAGARVAKTVRDDWTALERQDWFVYSSTFGWEKRANFRGLAAREYREFDSQGLVINVGRPQHRGAPSIFLLGDSCTYGLGVETESTFAVQLEERLEGFRVVNLGVPGYSSYQGLQVLKARSAMNPALIIASFSFNDRRYVLRQESQDSASHFHFIWRWSWLLGPTSMSYPFRALSSTLTNTIDLRTTPVRVPLQAYRRNLQEMVRITQAEGIPLVFMVLGDNPNFMFHVKKGLNLKTQGQLVKAARAFKESMALNPLASDLPRLYLAQTYGELGEEEKANQTSGIRPQVRFDGGSVLRLDADFSQAMIDVAREAGVSVFDARSILEGEPGVFFDIVHFDAVGHELIAEGLFQFIRENNLLEAVKQNPPVLAGNFG